MHIQVEEKQGNNRRITKHRSDWHGQKQGISITTPNGVTALFEINAREGNTRKKGTRPDTLGLTYLRPLLFYLELKVRSTVPTVHEPLRRLKQTLTFQ